MSAAVHAEMRLLDGRVIDVTGVSIQGLLVLLDELRLTLDDIEEIVTYVPRVPLTVNGVRCDGAACPKQREVWPSCCRLIQ